MPSKTELKMVLGVVVIEKHLWFGEAVHLVVASGAGLSLKVSERMVFPEAAMGLKYGFPGIVSCVELHTKCQR